MRTEGGGVGISASLFRPHSSVLRYSAIPLEARIAITSCQKTRNPSLKTGKEKGRLMYRRPLQYGLICIADGRSQNPPLNSW
jgi:hypothetical protein